jgi:hypothetical protein
MNKESEPIKTEDSQEWLKKFRREHPLQSLVYELKLGNGVWKALKNLLSK